MHEGISPYSFNVHEDECPGESGDVWADRDEQLLISPLELAQRNCRACGFYVNLWGELLDAVKDASYGEIVYAVLDLEERMKFVDFDEDLKASDLEYLLAVQRAREMYSQDQQIQAREEARRASKK